MPSPDRVPVAWLVRHQLRELAASRSFWLLLLVVGFLVGHAFMTSVEIYAEASGGGGGPAALSEGLRPLEGFVVPTFGAYDLAATLLFPFVVIRLVASEKQTGSLKVMLQAPMPFATVIAAKCAALMVAWAVAMLAGATALVLWCLLGGHLYGPETVLVLVGHLLRGGLTIGIGVAAAALAASASSAAIVALTFTLGTWALDYVAAARGGWAVVFAAFTPSSALRVFETGELRASTIVVLLVVSVVGAAIGAVWLRMGDALRRRAARLGSILVVGGLAVLAAARLRYSADLSEDRRNSFPAADEAALTAISPLRITAYLAPGDPRLVDLEQNVWAKLRRAMPSVQVTYVSRGRTGLFARPDEHYGEIWYEVNGKREMTRSSTEEIVLETIYRLAGRASPARGAASTYRGYPLVANPYPASLLFFIVWPVVVALAWWRLRRRPRRQRPELVPAGA